MHAGPDNSTKFTNIRRKQWAFVRSRFWWRMSAIFCCLFYHYQGVIQRGCWYILIRHPLLCNVAPIEQNNNGCSSSILVLCCLTTWTYSRISWNPAGHSKVFKKDILGVLSMPLLKNSMRGSQHEPTRNLLRFALKIQPGSQSNTHHSRPHKSPQE